MSSDERIRWLREQHEQIAALAAAPAVKAAASHAEETSRALAHALGGQAGLEHVAEQTRAAARIYDAAVVGKLFTGMIRPPIRDLDAWYRRTIPQDLLASLRDQLGTLEFGRPLIVEQMKLLSEMFGGANHAARFAEQLAGPMRQWGEMFKGYEEDEQRLLGEIVPLGWLISPSMGIRTIRLLARELDNRPIKEIDGWLVHHFDADRCTEIVSGLYDDSVFGLYQSLLDEGLEAHRKGLYRLAILAWIAAIDGIAEERLGVRRVFSVAKKKNGGKLRATIEQSSARREALNDALIEIFRRASVEDPDEHVPKRDQVMHGRHIDFGNERASIQLILVLEVMHFCAGQLVSTESESLSVTVRS